VSEQLKLIVTLVLFHPAALGAGTGVAVMVGGVLSILRTTAALAEFPALSVAVPEMLWLAPSELTTVAG